MLKFDDRGLIPGIVQDADTGEVLMLGYLSEESLRRTMETEQVWFYSRSRQELWHKGATSGNYLNLCSAWYDCDGDAILLISSSLLRGSSASQLAISRGDPSLSY
jgi:phosphoribosyl-ATP pyrophosphohydrolase/phosphoribosyl-AMP cyclohydrolase